MDGRLSRLCRSFPYPLLDLALIGFLIWVVYVWRLSELPLCGEEPRRAEVAREMVRTGDYIVPRQQGEIYCSRPPLQNWLIAWVASLRGKWDPWAVRLPSVLATAALAVAVYWYGASLVGRLGGLTAAVTIATMGQVMQIGGLGETDPLFAFLLGSSFLVWHAFVSGDKAPFWGSIAAGILAGLAGLTKGVQGPVWFLAVVTAWTIAEFCSSGVTWRKLLWLLFGTVSCTMTLTPWTIAYLQATSPVHTWQIWFGQIESRIELSSSYRHLLARPVETLVCWLPWTPLLIVYLWRKFWRQLEPAQRRIAIAWIIALAVTFPTVWLIPEARNRYFLPLYPAVAILLGLVLQEVASEKEVWLSNLWTRFVAGIGLLAVVVSLGSLVALVLRDRVPFEIGWDVRAILGFSAAVAAFWIVVEVLEHQPGSPPGGGLWGGTQGKVAIALAAVGLIVGLMHTVFAHASRAAAANDPSEQIAAIRRTLPEPEKLVSFGPVFHRFRYYYELPIRLLPLPRELSEIPPEITYFCLEGILTRRPPREGDASETDLSVRWPQEPLPLAQNQNATTFCGADSSAALSPPKHFVMETPDGGRLVAPALPFDWELMAVVPCGRNRRDKIQPAVIVGKVTRHIPVLAGVSENRPSCSEIR